VARPQSQQCRAKAGLKPGLEETWEKLIELVGNALKTTIMGYSTNLQADLNGSQMASIRATLLASDISLPC
jgi:hypothetical protein